MVRSGADAVACTVLRRIKGQREAMIAPAGKERKDNRTTSGM